MIPIEFSRAYQEAEYTERDQILAIAADYLEEHGQLAEARICRGEGPIAMVWCPPGSFRMGSPAWEFARSNNEDQVDVELTDGFWIGRFSVTQSQWESLLEPIELYEGGIGPNYPMYRIDWVDAFAYCEELTRQARDHKLLPQGWIYRLPTEAEWEYACRAGMTTATAFGDVLDGSQANFNGNYPYKGTESGPYPGRVCRVGQYPPNAWGLYDMHGNVWEWCWDAYAIKLLGGVNPHHNDPQSPLRVARGGCWQSDGEHCRSAHREPAQADDRRGFRGLRVVLARPFI